MIVLIDADVLIDAAIDRRPFSKDASEVLDLAQRRAYTACVAWHSLSNFYYIVRPVCQGSAARQFLRELLCFVAVAPTSTNHARNALDSPMPDFEDAMQVAAAAACGADAIVTRNMAHYVRSPVAAMPPVVFLRRLRASNGG